jgi:hypothetical protein
MTKLTQFIVLGATLMSIAAAAEHWQVANQPARENALVFARFIPRSSRDTLRALTTGVSRWGVFSENPWRHCFLRCFRVWLPLRKPERRRQLIVRLLSA